MDVNVKFLMKHCLGKSVNLDNPDDVIRGCCTNAYLDMNLGFKYIWNHDDLTKEEKEEFKNDFIEKYLVILERHNYKFSMELLHDCFELYGYTYDPNNEQRIVKTESKYLTIFGGVQKFVNMSFKYFYVFKELLNKEIDFSECHCPVDSYIIEALDIEDEDIKRSKWTKISEKTYIKIQNYIKRNILNPNSDAIKLGLTNIGNLAFDFINW